MKTRSKFEKPFHPHPVINRFFKKHAPWVIVRRWAVFKDGAQMEITTSGPGVMKEPSDDPYERQQVIVQYYEALAERAVEEFKAKKREAEAQDPDDVDDILEEVKESRDKARAAKAKLREAKDELEALTPATVTAKRREQARMEKARQKLRDELFEIKL